MEFVVFGTAIALAAVFLVSGVAKLVDLKGTRGAVRDFGVPSRHARTLGLLLPLGELGLVVLLVIPVTQMFGAIGALGLLALFNLAVWVNLSRGRSPSCRCFGQLHASPIGWRTIGRNVGLMLLAVVVSSYGLFGSDAFRSAWVEGLVTGTILSGIIAFVLFEFVDVSGWARRVSWLPVPVSGQSGQSAVLEVLSSQPDVVRDDGPLPQLPIGAPAPAFRLIDTEDERISLDDLVSHGKPVILVFVDPECDICDSILPEISWWQWIHSAEATLQVISSGPVEMNRAKGEGFSLSSILVQDDWEVADAYGSESVPSAILVQADGTIGSAVGDGPDEVRELLQRVSGSVMPRERNESLAHD